MDVLINRVFEVQSKRAQLYNQMEHSFRDFLEHPSRELLYTQQIEFTTLEMNTCSRQVIEVEKELKEKLNRADLASILRALQENEARKLELVRTTGHRASYFELRTLWHNLM